MNVNAKRLLIQSSHISQFHFCIRNLNHSFLQPLSQNCSIKPAELWNLRFSVRLNENQRKGSKVLVSRGVSDGFLGVFEQDPDRNNINDENKMVEKEKIPVVNVLKQANSLMPQVVIASTLLALVYPPLFTWFTSRYYAPTLGFLMFAIGVNSSEKDFVEAFKRPAAISAGYIGQFVVKPILGYIFGIISVSVLGLPTAVGAGVMLVSCVSGAQLSNYATFLTNPPMAPLSIVMTSLSTATAVFVTPLLSLLLIGKRLPVDVKGMVSSILQIVVTPIAAGLLLNRFFPRISNAIQPFLPPFSVLVTACGIGSPLALNVDSVLSPFGATLLAVLISFHLLAFIAGYFLTGLVFPKTPDLKALQRTISFETGMQSSLLGLALANRFFQDPLVAVPPAISTVLMSLMGFLLVMIWDKKKDV
ncbi:Sodium Bile acid symporter family [Euphorbia peplus]|nr:Sodium Bile acid symporter family [Euphorbia peplus]